MTANTSTRVPFIKSLRSRRVQSAHWVFGSLIKRIPHRGQEKLVMAGLHCKDYATTLIWFTVADELVNGCRCVSNRIVIDVNAAWMDA